MRDLYKRLGISPNDSVDKIREALNRCSDESVREDAECVLLDPVAREVYDRNLQLLQQIAQARKALGILKTPHWDAGLRVDFPAAKSGERQPKSKGQSATSSEGYHWGWSLFILLVLVGGTTFFRSSYWNYHRALLSDTDYAYSRFLEKHSDSKHVQEARAKREEVRADTALKNIERNIPKYLDGLDPNVRAHQDLIGNLDGIAKTFPATESGQKASALHKEARREMGKKITTPKDAIDYLRIFRDEASAGAVYESLMLMIPTEENLMELDSIPTFLTDLRNAGASEEEVESVEHAVKERQAELKAIFRDFSYVQNLNTKDAFERYLEQVPRGANSDKARRRLVDLEVEDILKGNVLGMPRLKALTFSSTTTRASIEVVNGTTFDLTVRFSGTDSQKQTIPPKQKKTLRVDKGDYQITANLAAEIVPPHAGIETIRYDKYTVSFVIVPIQN